MASLGLERKATVPAEARSFRCPGTDRLDHYEVGLWDLRFHERNMEASSAEDPMPDYRRRRLVIVAHCDSEMANSPQSYPFCRR